ncbi:hypothetical protein [Acidipila sp. EB88]|uniref:hypothetical protein n=1 Tax=Acidipila sp. EB88 TaxID=2305226 RepID=UPI000F5E52D8|nr:hypothetical protein [Acidipila sp. EB88]RRA48347.1 hypothetical protein D1Y84_08655 [Acidipila sp. EB88]
MFPTNLFCPRPPVGGAMRAWRGAGGALVLLLLIGALLAIPGVMHGEKDPDAKKPKPAKPPRVHSVVLGGAKKVPYSREGDPAGARAGESELKLRPLVVDGRVKEWTTGEAHDVTDRSFAVRRALRINDALPTDKNEHWVWQKGPWLLIDRTAGHMVPLKLPDYDPAVSEVSWFRDYAAYCGLTSTGKQLYAVVAQVAARKPLVVRKLAPWDGAAPHTAAACEPATWQRDPLRITFQATGAQPASFDLVGASAVLAEGGDAIEPTAPGDKTP